MDDRDSSHSTSSESITADSLSHDLFQERQVIDNPGIMSRVAGGAYNVTFVVVEGAANATTNILGGAKNVASAGIGGAGWLAGSALTTSVGVMKGLGSYILPARLKPTSVKDKSE